MSIKVYLNKAKYSIFINIYVFIWWANIWRLNQTLRWTNLMSMNFLFCCQNKMMNRFYKNLIISCSSCTKQSQETLSHSWENATFGHIIKIKIQNIDCIPGCTRYDCYLHLRCILTKSRTIKRLTQNRPSVVFLIIYFVLNEVWETWSLITNLVYNEKPIP